MSNFYARLCKNGHLDIKPHRLKGNEICNQCGEPVIDSCPACGELIKKWHYYGMVYLTPKNIKFNRPDVCPYCGQRFPWSEEG